MNLQELTFSNFLAAKQIDEEIQARYGSQIKEKNDFFQRLRGKISTILDMVAPWPNRNFETFHLSIIKQDCVEIKLYDESENERVVEFPTAWLSLEGKALYTAICEEEKKFEKNIFSIKSK